MKMDECDFCGFSIRKKSFNQLIASTYDVEKSDGSFEFDIYSFHKCHTNVLLSICVIDIDVMLKKWFV